MASLNKVQIIGNLGADPEMRFTTNGQAVANISVACNRKWTDHDGQQQEDTEWVRVICWAKTAENVSQYLTKGSQVYVEGRLQTRKWQDKSGADRYTTEVVAWQVLFLDSRSAHQDAPRSSDGGGGGGRPPAPAPADPDDLPFE